MTTIPTAPAWQRERAIILHRAFLAIQRGVAAGAPVTRLIDDLAADLQSREIVVAGHDGSEIDRRPLRASSQTIWRQLEKWKAGGQTVDALLHGYTSAGTHRTVPDLLKAEIQRRASLPTGGRDKHGRSPLSVVYQSLCDDWLVGKEIPGLGTWADWWACDPLTAHLPSPDRAPEFPFSEKSIRRHAGNKALRAMGNIGAASAQKHLPHLTLDYSQLRKCELYTLDDVRLDVIALDDHTGNVVEVVAYIMMEVASRSIPAFMVKPAGSVKAADVDELVARALQTPGYGIGVGYPTHIKFERGTVACSDAAQHVLEAGSAGRIQIHRTGMDGGIRWAGQAADRNSGHAAGKAVIESFNRQLHYRLLHLPGQRGNNAANSPAHLGVEDRSELGRNVKRDSLTRQAEVLGQIRAMSAASGQKTKLDLPVLLFSQVRAVVESAIAAHNADPGHDYQGHSARTEIETAPGVWNPLNS
jgi:hypothetical protein